MNYIGTIRTPFTEKFGIPRQPLLVMEAKGQIILPKTEFYLESLRGLENFSHLWLIFDFHGVHLDPVNALVRPPRFDGKKKMGVFATRSPHRPNHVGMSVVQFDEVKVTHSQIEIHVSGVDLLDKTPIYDIKPYIPYSDSLPYAKALGFEERPQSSAVAWNIEPEISLGEKILIEKIIALDPRPGHDRQNDSSFGVSIAGLNVRFRKVEESFQILEVTKVVL